MVVESDVREAEKFATAWKYLQGAHHRLDEARVMGEVQQAGGFLPERLNEVVNTLCEQARAAQQLILAVDRPSVPRWSRATRHTTSGACASPPGRNGVNGG